jgi:predicted DNA-binding antitoxin AbrB/MazE fold protein
MTLQIEAIYENGLLRPDEPLDLEPNTRVRITIETRSNVLSDTGLAPRGSLSELFGSVDLGYPTGADNESIDADLAREYGSTHEDAR